jgi:hypothetical protein
LPEREVIGRQKEEHRHQKKGAWPERQRELEKAVALLDEPTHRFTSLSEVPAGGGDIPPPAAWLSSSS